MIASLGQTSTSKMNGKEKWVNSAAKRVGLRRGANGAPHVHHEHGKQAIRSMAFPDKVY